MVRKAAGAAAPCRAFFSAAARPRRSNPASIGKLLAWAAATFPIASDCEITMEANPGTVDAAHFAGYRDAGVNRISVGVQSFQPKLLKFLGRVHSADEAEKALNIVKQSGFDNFSFDLIYANPGQTLADSKPISTPLWNLIRRTCPLTISLSRRARRSITNTAPAEWPIWTKT